jgi:hypothetical protein
MRTLLFLIFIVHILTANATTYFFSTSGNDSNAGTSPSSPWKTISKFNSVFASKSPGDNFLFNRGDTFYGKLVINRSGSSGLPITIGAYGTGANPVITGFTTISAWNNLGSNTWESTNAVSSLSTCNMVVINGVNTPMGRYPNTGYLTYQSFTSTSITSSSLNSSVTNWTGAEAVIRKNNWITDRVKITSASGGAINYINPSGYNGTANYGFFIQNDVRTLDEPNEWYYNPSTKKLRIYSATMPTSVQVSTIDTLVYIAGKNYISIDNLFLTGSNKASYLITSATHQTISNCNFNFSGINCILQNGLISDAISITNCIINNTNNNAIFLGAGGTNNLISYDTVKNTGLIPGASGSNSDNCIAIRTNANGTIENCRIDSSGYLGVQFNSSDVIVRNNFITNYCLTKMDGGGIYTYFGTTRSTRTNQKVYNNIILNGIGSIAGTTYTVPIVHGIYLDGMTSSVELYGNTISNNVYSGLFINSGDSAINAHDNTLYNNQYQLLVYSTITTFPDRNMTIKNNKCISKTATQKVSSWNNVQNSNDIVNFGSATSIDSNYYARPIDDSSTIETTINAFNSAAQRTFAGWQTYSGYDSHSSKSPKSITTLDDLTFVYNPTSVISTVPLNANYIDVKNASYNGTITLQPYTSAVLIKNGATINHPPTANAGQDQTITLPTNSLTLSGSGADSDGTISSYQWTKISGPSSYSILNFTSPVTSITGFVQGIYQFQLTVTDNNGATVTDTMQVTVNPAPNQSPVANAGSDQSIILPLNAVTLTGSGSDPDGTISSYHWKVISGPSDYNIMNASSPGTDVAGLVQGTYQFQLTVTDNNDATATDVVLVTVNAAGNISPNANAGSDQIVILPLNAITLSGSGSDVDGTVVSYVWTEVSGPSGYNIVNANSPSTDVSGLIQGTYQFQLTVTDNNGAIGTNIMQVTVNAAPNIPPVANAGTDQTATLPTNTITLSGSGSDADGTVVSYVWSEISGPSGYNIVNANSPVTDLTGLVQGVYQFQLQITDNNDAIGTDIMQVTVNAAPNQPPVADAGIDQSITLPANTITLSGSGSDVDGTISSYQWTVISGPSGYNIVNANSPSTDVSGLIQGTYQFQLTVTDNNGAIGTNIVQVTVNAAPNIPPVVKAGTDQTTTLPTNTITLSGSGGDADGTVVSYVWSEISGPSGYNIVNANSPFTDVTGLVEGIYQFQLQITDNNGAIGTDIVQVTVNAANIPPVANAGLDQTITLPTDSVTFSENGNDADGVIVSYAWTKISGPSSYTIVSATLPSTSVLGLIQGIYLFELQVTDDNGATSADTIQVTVNAATNISPMANAGSDQTIILPTNTVIFLGNGTDTDGTIVGYNWAKISGPSGYTIINATSASTDVTGLEQGLYQFQLKVTDNNGATGTDTIQVIVNIAGNISPIADAGPVQTITLPTDSVTLSGSGTDADGAIVGYNWTQISGPSGYNILNAKSSSANVTGLVQGVYQFQLEVTDNAGATGTGVVQVIVNAAPNISPVANASPDQTIKLPVNSVTLSGSGSDADGTIVSYEWTEVSGPSNYNIVNATSAVTDITGLVKGIYQFQLTVTDNNGAIGTDIMQVTVNAAPNIPPVANAGTDQTTTLPTNTLTLLGSGSDADGTVVGYDWTFISGPSSYNIVNTNLPATDVTGMVEGVYQFELTVTDNSGAIGTDIIEVTVNAAPNQPPVADAGLDQIITLPTNTLTLSGSGSDADGTILSYKWIKISGPSSYNIINPTSVVTDINNLVEGAYQFELKVTDNNGATATDIMQVTVSAAPNQPPVANAGSDQIIMLPADSLTVSGRGSDADGTIVSYKWIKISGPSSYSIVDPTSAITAISSLVEGVYQFELTVTDNDRAIAIDAMQVTVNAAPNQPPVANAGLDQIIMLPADSLTVSGSGSDPDGTGVSYLWTKISGPANYNILNATTATIDINSLVEGVYQFQLKVTDNKGISATDIMQVTVSPATNQPPVANAGSDQIITLPTNSLTISGKGSDADGIVASYQWSKISGPTNYNIVNPTSAATDINGLVQGIYQFELRITDNNGARGRDTVQITVNAAVNILPLAHAGSDITITLPVNTVSLAGSGSDADGKVVSYLWTKISGPAIYNITNASSPVTDVWGLAQGIYKFELKVTDNKGAINMDTIQITVNSANEAPVANAGADQTITLPTNSVTLPGSGTDADGTIVEYSWRQISGPLASMIVSANSALTLSNALVGGTYEFELTVTDNSGAVGKDTVAIVVAESRLNLDVRGNTIKAYPNPVVNETTLEINTSQVYSKLLLIVTDMNGEIVYKKEITAGQTNIKEKLNMSNFIKGTYTVTVYYSNKKNQSIKIIRL